MRPQLIWISIAGMLVAHPVKAEEIYTIKLKSSDLEKIGKVLPELPYKDVADLIQNIRMQIIQQQQAQQPAPASELKNDPPKPQD